MANKAVDAGTYGAGAAIGAVVGGGPLGAIIGVVVAHGAKEAAGNIKSMITKKDAEDGGPNVNVNVA